MGVADVSRDAWSIVDCAFCNDSKSIGKSGCVLCGSTGRGDPVAGGCVDDGNAAITSLRSLLIAATDWYRSFGFIAIACIMIALRRTRSSGGSVLNCASCFE